MYIRFLYQIHLHHTLQLSYHLNLFQESKTKISLLSLEEMIFSTFVTFGTRLNSYTLELSSKPSCPNEFSPVVYKIPDSVRTKVLLSKQNISFIVSVSVSREEIFVHTLYSLLLRAPSFPSLLEPAP